MSFLSFSTPVDIDIVLEDGDDRAMIDVKTDKNRREKVPLYMDGESVKGAVTIRPKDGKRLEHTGIKVQFIGTIGTVAPLKRMEPRSLTSYVRQRCFSIVATTTSSCLSDKNLRRVANSSIHKHSNLTSITLKSSTKRTTGSTCGYDTS